MINNFFVKNKTFTPLVEQVIDYYCGNKYKVLIWGDWNGNNKQANSELTYYEQIIKQFKDAGFIVELMVTDQKKEFAIAKPTKARALPRWKLAIKNI